MRRLCVTQAPIFTILSMSPEDQRRWDALRVTMEDLNVRTRAMALRLNQLLECYHSVMSAASEKYFLADELLSSRKSSSSSSSSSSSILQTKKYTTGSFGVMFEKKSFRQPLEPNMRQLPREECFHYHSCSSSTTAGRVSWYMVIMVHTGSHLIQWPKQFLLRGLLSCKSLPEDANPESSSRLPFFGSTVMGYTLLRFS